MCPKTTNEYFTNENLKTKIFKFIKYWSFFLFFTIFFYNFFKGSRANATPSSPSSSLGTYETVSESSDSSRYRNLLIPRGNQQQFLAGQNAQQLVSVETSNNGVASIQAKAASPRGHSLLKDLYAGPETLYSAGDQEEYESSRRLGLDRQERPESEIWEMYPNFSPGFPLLHAGSLNQPLPYKEQVNQVVIDIKELELSNKLRPHHCDQVRQGIEEIRNRQAEGPGLQILQDIVKEFAQVEQPFNPDPAEQPFYPEEQQQLVREEEFFSDEEAQSQVSTDNEQEEEYETADESIATVDLEEAVRNRGNVLLEIERLEPSFFVDLQQISMEETSFRQAGLGIPVDAPYKIERVKVEYLEWKKLKLKNAKFTIPLGTMGSYSDIKALLKNDDVVLATGCQIDHIFPRAFTRHIGLGDQNDNLDDTLCIVIDGDINRERTKRKYKPFHNKIDFSNDFIKNLQSMSNTNLEIIEKLIDEEYQQTNTDLGRTLKQRYKEGFQEQLEWFYNKYYNDLNLTGSNSNLFFSAEYVNHRALEGWNTLKEHISSLTLPNPNDLNDPTNRPILKQYSAILNDYFAHFQKIANFTNGTASYFQTNKIVSNELERFFDATKQAVLSGLASTNFRQLNIIEETYNKVKNTRFQPISQTLLKLQCTAHKDFGLYKFLYNTLCAWKWRKTK